MTIRERDGANPQFSAEAYAARKALMMRQQGIFSESSERSGIPTVGAAITAGTPYFTPLPLLKGDPLTNFVVEVGTVGASLTLSRFAAYRVAPGGATVTQIANTLTGDVTATVQGAVGTKVLPISTGTIIWPDDEVIVVGAIFVGTTPPIFMRGPTNPVQQVIPGAQVAPSGKGSAGGLTDLPASASVLYASTSAGFWVGAS